MNRWFDIYHPPRWLTCLLLPLSLLYSLAMRLRSALYRRGIFRSYKLDIPVISVGNLTVGGTGKTPVTAFLAGHLRERGWKPVIISRGYGRSRPDREAEDEVLVVSDGKTVLAPAHIAGDEPFLLASALPTIPVICHSNRARAGRWAQENLDVDLVLLDDGFQHLALKREYDLVLVDGRLPWGNGHVLPAGPMREPLSAIKRASFVLCTRLSGPEIPQAITSTLAALDKDIPIQGSRFVPGSSLDGPDMPTPYLPALQGKKVLAFCGLARPDQFFEMLDLSGIKPLAVLRFEDHQQYGHPEITRINTSCREYGVELIICTQKDFVKLNPAEFSLPLYAVPLTLEVFDTRWLVELEALLPRQA